MPGNYHHNPDPALAELLHLVAQEGWGNEHVAGDADAGYEATLVVIEPGEQQELSEAFDREIPSGNFLVTRDPHGTVTLHEYTTAPLARQAFTDLATAAGPGPDDGTITVAGPPGAYTITLGGRLLGHVSGPEQAVAILREAMDTEQDWPDAWFVSDNGIPTASTRGAGD
jgi:hypothetical protein